MTTLYGITPTGTVVTRNTKVGYDIGIVRDGRLVRCTYDVERAIRFATHPGDVIVGLTRAPLHSYDRTYVTTIGGRTVCYPRCYACDNPAFGRAKRWNGQKYFYAPACKTRHALKEAS